MGENDESTLVAASKSYHRPDSELVPMTITDSLDGPVKTEVADAGFLEGTEDKAGDDIARDQYLADETVSGFIDYLRKYLGTEANPAARLCHSYVHEKEGYEWQCDGLLDAARRYRFTVLKYFRPLTGAVDFRSLAANGLVLRDLEGRLRGAVARGHEADAISAAKDIQRWGGTNRGEHNSAAINHLSGLPGGFVGYLTTCRISFGGGTALSLRAFIGSGYGLRSNAGFTKIYSLLFDDFVIYDSRVAAALCLLIVRFWCKRNLHSQRRVPIPRNLQFLCMPEYKNRRRDPNANDLQIGTFPSGSGLPVFVRHLTSNVYANWILTAALQGSLFETEVVKYPHPYPVKAIRALEAALFMIGYNLNGNWPHTG